jgi:hypothetical protein
MPVSSRISRPAGGRSAHVQAADQPDHDGNDQYQARDRVWSRDPEERDAVSGRSMSGEKSKGSERDPFVWFVCKMLLTFFTVTAVDLVAVSLLTHKLRVWFPGLARCALGDAHRSVGRVAAKSVTHVPGINRNLCVRNGPGGLWLRGLDSNHD